MAFNKNVGYGQAQIGGIPFTTGKVFVVADSSNANFNDIDLLFTPDDEGVSRRHSTIDSAIGACTHDAGDIILVASCVHAPIAESIVLTMLVILS